jgi:transcriptional regulator with XRE-family HTH domain
MQQQTFGQRLAQLRQASGLTVYGLAKAAGIANGHVAAYEAGKKSVQGETLAALARVLGVSLGAFDGVQWPPTRRKKSLGKS